MVRVMHEVGAALTRHDDGVEERALVPARAGSELALHVLHLAPSAATTVGTDTHDTLLFAVAGTAHLVESGLRHGLARGTSALVAEGETAELTAGANGLSVLAMTAGGGVDHHAPIGAREATVQLDEVEPGEATGSRSFQVLYGPHNGSTRATLFVGYIPPGRATWHYHLYDEIVWVLRGPGALHLDGDVEELEEGVAFRLSPREEHIVENRQEHADLAVLGLFTPAGSPSAAYLRPDVAAAYTFAG